MSDGELNFIDPIGNGFGLTVDYFPDALEGYLAAWTQSMIEDQITEESFPFFATGRIWDDGTQWNAVRLESHAIYPKTPEDASSIVREPIEVESRPSDFADRPRDANTQWIHAGIWTKLGVGGRKLLGYLATFTNSA